MARALEEGPAERRALTERVVAFADGLLDGLAERRVWTTEGGTFGAAWRRYFELEAAAESWSQVGGDIGRKRAYFWSVLGDWTLRLSMAAPRD